MNVKKSMFVDIEKAINLSKNSSIGAPNFLLALGLCCYTEYWGIFPFNGIYRLLIFGWFR
jgi:hypothetical protein